MQISSFRSIIKNYSAVFLDSYGVVKNHRGLIEGVPEVIDLIRKSEKPLRILTNDASRSQERHAYQFEKLGLYAISPKEIITSGMMAKQFLENKIPAGKIAYLGTNQAAQYIIQAGLEAIPVGQINDNRIEEIKAIVFLDDEGFDWNYDINASLNLLRKQNIPAIVANSDKIYPITKNNVSIATGGIAQLVENILGREFIHFGKPDSQMFMYAFEDLNKEGNFARKDILMVGDTLHTDILGGNKFGISTLLVLSGNTRAENVETLIQASGVIPDFISKSIVD